MLHEMAKVQVPFESSHINLLRNSGDYQALTDILFERAIAFLWENLPGNGLRNEHDLPVTSTRLAVGRTKEQAAFVSVKNV